MYRRRLARTALALMGITHAVIAALTTVFTNLSSRDAALMMALTAPALVPALVFWAGPSTGGRCPSSGTWTWRCGVPAVRGPARDEPKAIEAFNAAQALPYRLGGIRCVDAVRGLAVIAWGGGSSGFDAATALRLLGGWDADPLAMGLYEILLLRDMLRPLLGQLGSRHHLPVRRALAGGPAGQARGLLPGA